MRRVDHLPRVFLLSAASPMGVSESLYVRVRYRVEVPSKISNNNNNIHLCYAFSVSSNKIAALLILFSFYMFKSTHNNEVIRGRMKF
jgi:hypothetical protein